MNKLVATILQNPVEYNESAVRLAELLKACQDDKAKVNRHLRGHMAKEHEYRRQNEALHAWVRLTGLDPDEVIRNYEPSA